MAILNFDATQVDPSQSFDPIPAGEYQAQLVESSMESLKSGQGEYLKLQFEVMAGPFAGRRLFTNLCLRHPNTQTVEIAQRQLSALCHAAGVFQLQDSQQLHGRPVVVKVRVKDDPQYGPKNEISTFKAPAGGQPSLPVYQQQPQFQQQATAHQQPQPQQFQQPQAPTPQMLQAPQQSLQQPPANQPQGHQGVSMPPLNGGAPWMQKAS